MKDFIYIIDDKFMFLSVDEEISYREAWKLVHHDISEKNKLTARKNTIKEKYKCGFQSIRSFTDLENIITV